MNRIFHFAFILMCFALSACGQKSDALGLVENEQLKPYTEAFEPAREMLLQGNYDLLLDKITTKPKTKDGKVFSSEESKDWFIKTGSELALVERGLLALNCGDFQKALFFFEVAEMKMLETEERHPFLKLINDISKGTVATIVGAEEIHDYKMRGYEKVMLYNYKALCYMLLGDRTAFNVTRKAIDRQKEEWEKFQQLVAEIEAKQAEKEKMVDEEIKEVFKQIVVDARDDATKKKASLVPHAFVNPFGDYMDAVLWELDGIDNASHRDNARIAYQKVVENNKDCSAAKKAVKEVRRGVPKGKKLVHVILADGFAPHKKIVMEGY